MALINLRNALMTGKWLPYDAEVEYLESTGTQYILTGVTGGAARWEIGAKANRADTTQVLVSMNRSANGGYYFGVLAGVWGFGGSGNNTTIAGTTYADINATIVGTGTSTATVNGESCSRIQPGGASADEWTLFASGPTKLPFYGRIYYARCYQNNTLVRDYIPVRKGTVGHLYDRVSRKLFGNAGTGDFVLGPDVVPVEYIENVASSYINTEFKADNACKFEIDFENKKTEPSGTYNPWLFGSRNGSASAVDKSCVFLGYNIGTAYAMMGSANPTFNQGLVISGRHTLTMSLSEGVGIDGVAVATYTPSEQEQIYTNTHPNVLFNMWNGSLLNNYFIGRVYSFKVLKNGVPQINFQPIRVGTEGAMMDVLTRRIYRNAGTGAFSYGNDLKYPIPSE